jgi:rSAM/selenodomain-associated transferase 1
MTPLTFAIGVFARAPVAGRVKTRLIPAIGAQSAARLQAHLIERSLAAATAVMRARTTLFVDGDLRHPAIVEPARRFGVPVRAQTGDDLGERMHCGFIEMLATLPRAIVVGTDNLTLTADLLRHAADALDHADAVIQPAEDGGYTLIGLRHPCGALFDGLPWGTCEVLRMTCVRIEAAGLRSARLPQTWDLDAPSDLQRALREGLLSPDAFS